MRYSTGGMWGVAIYFAENASYSKRYAYNTTEGYKQFFMARVLVGTPIALPADANIKKPPAKPITTGITEYYDSIQGETNGSRVYMIYENGKAFPDYLITYK